MTSEEGKGSIFSVTFKVMCLTNKQMVEPKLSKKLDSFLSSSRKNSGSIDSNGTLQRLLIVNDDLFQLEFYA